MKKECEIVIDIIQEKVHSNGDIQYVVSIDDCPCDAFILNFMYENIVHRVGHRTTEILLGINNLSYFKEYKSLLTRFNVKYPIDMDLPPISKSEDLIINTLNQYEYNHHKDTTDRSYGSCIYLNLDSKSITVVYPTIKKHFKLSEKEYKKFKSEFPRGFIYFIENIKNHLNRVSGEYISVFHVVGLDSSKYILKYADENNKLSQILLTFLDTELRSN